MVIRDLSHWVRDFLSFILNRLLWDNKGVVIMKDPCSLKRGEWVMGNGHFPFISALWVVCVIRSSNGADLAR